MSQDIRVDKHRRYHKNMNGMKFKAIVGIFIYTLIICITMISNTSYASTNDSPTNLPYIGPEAETCLINKPEPVESLNGDSFDDRDGGYLTSEDCKTLYVKPPSIGVIEEASVRETLFASLCGPIRSLVGMVNDVFKYRVENENKNNNLLEKISSTRDEEERNQLFEELQKTTANISYALKILNRMKQDIKNISSGDVAATYSANISLDWTRWVQAYAKSNPGLTVVPLPISVGLLSAKLVDSTPLTSPRDGQGLFETIEAKPIIDSRVSGLKLRELTKDLSLPFPDFVAGYKGDATLMGQSASLQLEMSSFGYCALDSLENNNQTVFTYMAPTYTYFYPVQTKATYKIEINTGKFKETIKSLLKNSSGRALTSTAVFEAVTPEEVHVSMNPGAFSGDKAQELKEEYEIGLKKMVLDGIMARISEKIDTIYQSAHYTISTPKLTRVCHKKNYILWSKTVCNNHTYYVSETKFDSDKFDKYLSELVGESESGRVQKYINHTLLDSTAFNPKM